MKSNMSKAQELYLRNETIGATVNLLNAFGFYLQAESNSPEEDQWDATIMDQVVEVTKDGADGLAGHVIIALLAMIHRCSDPEMIQQFLDENGAEMQRQMEELNGD